MFNSQMKRVLQYLCCINTRGLHGPFQYQESLLPTIHMLATNHLLYSYTFFFHANIFCLKIDLYTAASQNALQQT